MKTCTACLNFKKRASLRLSKRTGSRPANHLKATGTPITREGAPPKHLLQSLALVRQHWPLVINRLLTNKYLDFIDHLAHHLRTTRRKAVEQFVDYAISYVQGDSAAIKAHHLDKVLAPKLKKDLYVYSFYGERISSMNMTLLLASLYAEEITVIEQLSAKKRHASRHRFLRTKIPAGRGIKRQAD
jgi:hypothetical protein